jgi:hypothetical protein
LAVDASKVTRYISFPFSYPCCVGISIASFDNPNLNSEAGPIIFVKLVLDGNSEAPGLDSLSVLSTVSFGSFAEVGSDDDDDDDVLVAFIF